MCNKPFKETLTVLKATNFLETWQKDCSTSIHIFLIYLFTSFIQDASIKIYLAK